MDAAVRNALVAYHQLEKLTQSALAKTSLVQHCLLTGDHVCKMAHGYAVRAVLMWALDQLQTYAPRQHAVLYERYVEGLSVRAYADRHFIGERAAHGRRKTAIKKMSKRIIEITEEEHSHCRQRMLEVRYADCSPIGQQVLRFLTVFEETVPFALLLQEISDAESSIGELQQLNLVRLIGDTIGLHLEIGRTFTHHLTPTEHLTWHTLAQQRYAKQRRWIEAVKHGCEAGLWQESAECLIAHQEQLLTDKRLTDLLQRFQPHQLAVDCWAELQIIRGILAEHNHHIDTADQIYQGLLNRPIDPTILAKAYYRLGRIYRQKDVHAAQIYYTAARRKLKSDQRIASQKLLAHVYISEAYLYLDTLPNAKRATENLRAAKTIIDNHDAQIWFSTHADWHNGWGNYYKSKHDYQQAIPHYWQALQYAQEGGLLHRSLRLTHNLGNQHFHLAQYEKANAYFQSSLELAKQAEDLRLVAMNRKGLGYCFYGLEQYSDAIQQYRAAYDYFQQSEHQFYLISSCHDLAEAYLAAGEPLNALPYYQQGVDLATSLGSTQMQQLFVQLHSQFQELSHGLYDDQRMIINFTRQTGKITKREYQRMTGCGKGTAERRLKELLARNILQVAGGGRSTYYYVVQTTS